MGTSISIAKQNILPSRDLPLLALRAAMELNLTVAVITAERDDYYLLSSNCLTKATAIERSMVTTMLPQFHFWMQELSELVQKNYTLAP